MKTITLKNIDVQEFIVRPGDNVATVAYRVLDDTGALVSATSVSYKIDGLNAQVQTVISNLIDRISALITTKEGL